MCNSALEWLWMKIGMMNIVKLSYWAMRDLKIISHLKMFCQNCRIAELKPRILAWQFYCLIIYKSVLRMLIPVDKSCCVRNLSVRICAITITINILEMYNCQRKRVWGSGKTRLAQAYLHIVTLFVLLSSTMDILLGDTSTWCE